MPAVTAMGRHTINITKDTLKKLYGDKLQCKYGDTDSYFFSLNKTCAEIIDMRLEEAYKYFNGNRFTTDDNRNNLIITKKKNK